MKFFKLTKAVPNSEYDGRHRRDLKALKEYPEGAFIRAVEDRGWTRYDIKLKYWECIPYDDAQALIPHLKEQPPEYMSLEEMADSEWVGLGQFCTMAIEVLVRDGVLTKADVLEAYKSHEDA